MSTRPDRIYISGLVTSDDDGMKGEHHLIPRRIVRREDGTQYRRKFYWPLLQRRIRYLINTINGDNSNPYFTYARLYEELYQPLVETLQIEQESSTDTTDEQQEETSDTVQSKDKVYRIKVRFKSRSSENTHILKFTTTEVPSVINTTSKTRNHPGDFTKEVPRLQPLSCWIRCAAPAKLPTLSSTVLPLLGRAYCTLLQRSHTVLLVPFAVLSPGLVTMLTPNLPSMWLSPTAQMLTLPMLSLFRPDERAAALPQPNTKGTATPLAILACKCRMLLRHSDLAYHRRHSISNMRLLRSYRADRLHR